MDTSSTKIVPNLDDRDTRESIQFEIMPSTSIFAESTSILLQRGTHIQEEHLELVLSLDLIKNFSKTLIVRNLTPINSALE